MTQRIFCVLKDNLFRPGEEEAGGVPYEGRAGRGCPGSSTLTSHAAVVRGTKALVKTKKLKKTWRMATVDSYGGSLKDKSFNYLDFSKGLLTLLVYKRNCKQPLCRVHKGS